MERRRLLLATLQRGGGGDVQKSNEIWYTTTNGEVYSGYGITDTDYGATLVSNTYNDGKGVMTFNGKVTQISGYGFEEDPRIKTLRFPDTLTTIGNGVFAYTQNLEEVWLGAGVTRIGAGAFTAMGGSVSVDARKVYLPTLTPPTIEEDSFMPPTIYVPRASYTAYTAAWSNYLAMESAVEPYDFE